MAYKNYGFLDEKETNWLERLWLPSCVVTLLILLILVIMLTWEPKMPRENIERVLPSYVFTGQSVPRPE